MHIDPDQLRALRERKGLSLRQLAERARVSVRQLHRLEKELPSPRGVREHTVNQLAGALRIEPGVLTGAQPMPVFDATESPGGDERVKISALLQPEVHLAYALIKRRYKVNQTTIFNLAPLLFTLLAEGSLAWRRRKLEEVEEATDRVRNSDTNSAGGRIGHLSFVNAVYHVDEGSSAEEESIQKNDLFGREVGEETFDLGYNPSTNNPFVDYLREFASKIRKPDIVRVDDDELNYGPLENLPFYSICGEELRQIAGGSDEALTSLTRGFARLGDIPDELWVEDATEERVRWLEEQYSEEARRADDESLAEFIREFGRDGAGAE